MTTSSAEAKRVVRFIEQFCTLGGSFLGQPFTLERFQRDVIADIYREGSDGKRQRRQYLLGLPRKNGKSTLAAALALYHLFADPHDASPVVISAAGDRQQAKIVFGEAKRMVLASPALRRHANVYRDHIATDNGGIYRAVSADAGLQQGLNPSFVVVDELHVFKNNELVEALTLGSAMRRSPLFLFISTAGFELESPLGRMYEYGRKVESGEVVDPTFGFTWFGPKDGEHFDPASVAVWRRFNPAFHLMSADDFASSFKKTPLAAFIRFRLNGWTATESSWLPFGAWARLADDSDPLMWGEKVILAFDGAWKGDSTGLTATRLRDGRTFVLGHWEAPPGDRDWRTPIGVVKLTILEAWATYDAVELAADPAFQRQLLLELEEAGVNVVEFPNTAKRMSAATQAMYEAVMDGQISHDGSPALARHVANCVLKEDMYGARITKASKMSRRHIDLAVCAVIGNYRALTYTQPEQEKSYFLDLDSF